MKTRRQGNDWESEKHIFIQIETVWYQVICHWPALQLPKQFVRIPLEKLDREGEIKKTGKKTWIPISERVNHIMH